MKNENLKEVMGSHVILNFHIVFFFFFGKNVLITYIFDIQL